MFRATQEFYIVYDDLAGLKESGEVQINGFKVGQVNDIALQDITPRKLIVRIIVRKKYNIPKGTVAKLSSIDFMGTKAIELMLSDTDVYHKNGDTLISKMGQGIMDKVEELEEKVVHITYSIDTLLGKLNTVFDEDMGLNIQKTASNLKTVSESMKDMLDERGELREAVRQLNIVLSQIEKSFQTLPGTMDNLNAISNSLEEADLGLLISSARLTILKMNEILEKTAAGDGTLGQLVHNDSLYVQLTKAATNLEVLLKDVNERPKRYVHFSVFGKKDK